MNEGFQLRNNGLYCSIDKSYVDIFFSLVDYRNNYFTSSDPEKIIEFYNGFKNRDQLIQWMRERPKGVHTIREVEGDKDIIVVIPTADFNGKFAKECRENIFKGLHIVFVESGVDNYYFNYAHNCNVGLKKAMEYNPKWVVVSNDDMYKRDDVRVLRESLSKIDEKIDTVFTSEGLYHSRFVLLSYRTVRRHLAINLIGNFEKRRLSIEKKFRIDVVFGTTLGLKKFLYQQDKKVKYSGSFGIYSNRFIANNDLKIYDETYINGGEDIDLALNIHLCKQSSMKIDYKIGDLIGQTIGPYDSKRRLRGIVDDCYFNFKFHSKITNLTVKED